MTIPNDDHVDHVVSVAARALGSLGLFLDFDGSLAPIVDDPDAARILPGVSDDLETLCGRGVNVAVVSGRPIAFLETQVGPRVTLAGLYGLETRVDGEVRSHPGAEEWRPSVSRAVEAAEHRFAGSGVVVEGKGLSCTIHHRRVPEEAGAVGAWASSFAHRAGLRARPAKMSVELHPPIDLDKGTVVARLAGPCATVVYAGDDAGDLPAFAALDRLAVDGREVLRIAVGTDELPAALRTSADVVLAEPATLARVIELLARS